MTGLDCNILVQLALSDHPANAATVATVQAEVKSGSRLVFRRWSSMNFFTSSPMRDVSVRL
jgi:hypothetical protein